MDTVGIEIGSRVRRVVPFAIKSLDGESADVHAFAGYASAFNVVDRMGEVIVPGAFTLTLPAFLKAGVICWQHDWTTPIGKPTKAHEDARGLYIEARVSDTGAGRDALTLMRDGVISAMSIGYSVQGYEVWSEEQAVAHLGADEASRAMANVPPWRDGIVAITQLELYEASPVSVPANPEAVITAVKSALEAGAPLAVSVDTIATLAHTITVQFRAMHATRVKEGRVLSSANRQKIADIRDTLSGIVDSLTTLHEDTAPVDGKAWMAEYRRHVESRRAFLS